MILAKGTLLNRTTGLYVSLRTKCILTISGIIIFICRGSTSNFGYFQVPRSDTMAAAPTPSSSVPTKEQDWADISDDEEEEPAPTVKVDSLDLTSLSLNEKNKQATTGDSPQSRWLNR
jgi:hypothetical protein